jgi:NitT/TauT family transport system ATP-binding protein
MQATVVPKLRSDKVSIEYRSSDSSRLVVALQELSIDIADGEFLTIVGPSGCGKTTFLNAVSGMIPISSGQLLLDGQSVAGPGADRGVVFQQPLLLPWRTVRGNVAYGLEVQGASRAVIHERVEHFIRLVGLEGFEDSYPSQLSGGMQQRANLARALAIDPKLLLLDEPFAALDAQTREFMQSELLTIWGSTRKTALFVTHQIDEAVYLADRVLVLSARPGRVVDLVTVDIPRPRALDVKTSPEFLRCHQRIWSAVVKEAAKARRGEGAAALNEIPST